MEDQDTTREGLIRELGEITRLQRIGALFVADKSMQEVLGEILEAAIDITYADMGNIQLIDDHSGNLKIVAHRGFDQAFLDYWNEVHEGQGSCGTALESGKRTIIEDVAQSTIFKDTPALDVQLTAGVRAVQSTPLIGRSGKVIRVLSTHFRSPHRPDERTLRVLDLLARQTTDIIERAQADQALRNSEERFRRISSLTSDIAYSCTKPNNAAYSIDWIIGAAERITGHSEDAIKALGCWRNLVIDEDLPLFDSKVIGLAPGMSGSCELRLRHESGKIVWVASLAECVFDLGSPDRLRLHGGLVDITARNMAEQAITSFPRPQACRCGYFPEYASGCSALGHFP
jgi:PAS domain-containing protein